MTAQRVCQFGGLPCQGQLSTFPAPQEFVRNGLTCRLLQQKGKLVLYEARSTVDLRVRSFEVHILRFWPERTINGKQLPAGPRLASSEEFGQWAWSYTTIGAAQRKFQGVRA